MENLNILIKKSDTEFHWQNKNIGKEVLATKTEKGYSVNFEDNPELEITDRFYSFGYLDEKAIEILK